MGKKSFVFYDNWITLFNSLSDENAGILIKAICDYRAGNEPIIENDIIKALYSMMIDLIKKDTEKYDETCRKRRESANSRWENQKGTNEYNSMQMYANASKSIQKDYDIDNDIDNDIDIKEKYIKKKSAKAFIPPTVDEVRAYCLERQNKVDAETFVNFYESKGWCVGKTKMKDWKACVRTWERNRKDNTAYETYKKTISAGYDFEELEREAKGETLI